jgi:glycosyltransferase involved in cell wall biosynthesis
MNSKPVIYYTQLYFLDSAIETIKCIKYDLDIHLIIEISKDSILSTVLEIDMHKIKSGFNDIYSITKDSNSPMLTSIFSNIKSVQVFYFSSRRTFNLHTLYQTLDLAAYMKALRPLTIHFDSTSLRAFGTNLILRGIRVIVTIHDPLPHSGEYSWKIKVSQYLYLLYSSKIILYSKYARSLFRSAFPSKFAISDHIHLLPYSYISLTQSHYESNNNYILFFGRLSLYKGLDLLLDSIPYVLMENPGARIMIAGKPDNGFTLPVSLLRNEVLYISRYLEVTELRDLIRNAKFIVCPYRDATQSGVLMTAFAMHKCVVATNVGSFPEYIFHDHNGLLSYPNPIDLAFNLNKALKDNYYLKMNNNIKNSDYSSIVLQNRAILKYTYTSF